MGKTLVIVESPAKAKTINKYLGTGFVVRSSVGHVRDLPVSGQAAKTTARTKKSTQESAEPQHASVGRSKSALIHRMGIDPEHGWEADYQILPGKEKVVEELKKLAKDADAVYLATDLDREGEAIAWHLREVIGGAEQRFKRVVFNEITRTAIEEAFAHPGELNIARVQAQQARRFLDRVVGYMVSPLLWEKIARGLSAGRVQSVAVRLVVEREREIRAFVPQEYWQIFALTETPQRNALTLEVVRESDKVFRPVSRSETEVALAVLGIAEYRVLRREDKPTRTRPSAPFITSTLQQAASTRLGFPVKKTMMLAQRLYEAGHITYMRTDSTNLSAEAVENCRGYIEQNFGTAYLPTKAIVWASSEDAQEAHEAIRPSEVGTGPEGVSGLEKDAHRLYELIWRQFVACQMPDAQYLSTIISVQAQEFELRARGRILKFDGFTRVLPTLQKDKDPEEQVLPDVTQGMLLSLKELKPSQHFTRPTPHFTEATLVRELEKKGIGRPSTYAAIISTIQERGYVRIDQRRLYAEKMGEIVTDRLYENFSNLMDYDFTAQLEGELDKIAHNKRPWKQVLDDFYKDFSVRLSKASSDGGMRRNQPTETAINCPACSRPMQIRTASTGVFLGCSGYALPIKERCKETINLVPGEEVVSVDAQDDGEIESQALRSMRRCRLCQTAMNVYVIDEKRKIHICGNSPDCGGHELEEGNFRFKGYDGPTLTCDKCSSVMQLKSGRFGKYFGCTQAGCTNTRKLLRNGEAAPPKSIPIPMPQLRCARHEDFFLLRDGAAGLFLAASQFPRVRETRAPTIEELKTVGTQLDPKFQFLLSAPPRDSQGNPAVLRFLRKTKEQYVASEINGKSTGWQAFYRNGGWHVSVRKSASEVSEHQE